jgi:hypothetical protein
MDVRKIGYDYAFSIEVLRDRVGIWVFEYVYEPSCSTKQECPSEDQLL